MVRRTEALPTRFQVLGERSSGTNLVNRLLARNSNLNATEILGWKHGFPQMMAIPADLAVICVVRNAADWALSMHAKPWHTVPDMQALEFSDFIRAPWQTIIDRPRYFEGAKQLIGQTLQPDRHPLTGELFRNLFALRQAKLTSLLGFLNRDCTCAVLRTEEVQDAPEERIGQLVDALGGTGRGGGFRTVHRRLGSRFRPAIAERPATPDRITETDLAFLRAEVAREQESALGYSY